MVKAWEMGEMLFVWEEAKDLCLCSDYIIFLLSCVSDTLLSSEMVLLFFFTDIESMIALKFH